MNSLHKAPLIMSPPLKFETVCLVALEHQDTEYLRLKLPAGYKAKAHPGKRTGRHPVELTIDNNDVLLRVRAPVGDRWHDYPLQIVDDHDEPVGATTIRVTTPGKGDGSLRSDED